MQNVVQMHSRCPACYRSSVTDNRMGQLKCSRCGWWCFYQLCEPVDKERVEHWEEVNREIGKYSYQW